MTVLAVPAWLFSNRYTVYDGDTVVARIDGKVMREGATLRLGERVLEVTRAGLVRGTLVLSEFGAETGRAALDRVLGGSWRIQTPAGEYRLVSPSWRRRLYELRTAADVVIGTIRPQVWYSRRIVADFAPDVPADVGVFALVVVMTQWRRDDSAAAAGTS